MTVQSRVIKNGGCWTEEQTVLLQRTAVKGVGVAEYRRDANTDPAEV